MLGSIKGLKAYDTRNVYTVTPENIRIILKAWHHAALEFTQGNIGLYAFTQDSIKTGKLIEKYVSEYALSQHLEKIGYGREHATAARKNADHLNALFNVAQDAALMMSGKQFLMDSLRRTRRTKLNDGERTNSEIILLAQRRNGSPQHASFGYELEWMASNLAVLSRAYDMRFNPADVWGIDHKVGKRIHAIRRGYGLPEVKA